MNPYLSRWQFTMVIGSLMAACAVPFVVSTHAGRVDPVRVGCAVLGTHADGRSAGHQRHPLGELQHGIAESAPVHGYFLWSLPNHFKWSRGYSERFGIPRVDFATQQRTPKLSLQFYREVIGRNTV